MNGEGFAVALRSGGHIRANLDDDFAFVREFDGIPNEIDDDLSEAGDVSDHFIGDARIEF